MDSPVYGGALARSVAQRFGVSLSHLQHWIRRAGFLRLDWVVWTDRQRVSSAPANRTPDSVEARILQARGSPRSSPLLEFGAHAIHVSALGTRP